MNKLARRLTVASDVGIYCGLVLSALLPTISSARLIPEEQRDSERLRELVEYDASGDSECARDRKKPSSRRQ